MLILFSLIESKHKKSASNQSRKTNSYIPQPGDLVFSPHEMSVSEQHLNNGRRFTPAGAAAGAFCLLR